MCVYACACVRGLYVLRCVREPVCVQAVWRVCYFACATTQMHERVTAVLMYIINKVVYLGNSAQVDCCHLLLNLHWCNVPAPCPYEPSADRDGYFQLIGSPNEIFRCGDGMVFLRLPCGCVPNSESKSLLNALVA